MANEEQLSILRQGVEVWNEWREENPNVKINLSNADLSRINLSKVDPKGVSAKFKFAHFVGPAYI